MVKRTHQQGTSEIGLTYLEQTGDPACTPVLCDAGDPYTGLDRFGRVVDQRWLKSNEVTNPLDRFGYGYDRNSNRLYRENRIDATFSELYHSGGGYDNLNQLTNFQRSTLNTTKDGIDGTPRRTQSWALDEQGNWSTLTTDGTPQNRQHNYQNQATQVGSTNLAFDNNGNTKTDEHGRQYVYDAWDRLVEVKDSSGNRLARFSYDALGRRIAETGNGPAKDFYYLATWQPASSGSLPTGCGSWRSTARPTTSRSRSSSTSSHTRPGSAWTCRRIAARRTGTVMMTTTRTRMTANTAARWTPTT